MPLRRTKRSDGRKRPRWKDGSHAKVENTDAEHSRCDGFAFEPNPANEPLEKVQSLRIGKLSSVFRTSDKYSSDN